MSEFEKPAFIDVTSLKINPEYERLIPQMSIDDDEAFDESIKNNGIEQPITINDKHVLLDGHSRYKKALKYKIKLIPYLIKSFEEKLEEKKFVIETNLKRRHLSTIQKVKLAVPLLEIEQELAKKRQTAYLKKGTHSPLASSDADGKKTLASNDAKVKGKAAAIISKKYGLSTSTLERGKTVLQKASKEDLKELEEHPEKTSINKIYKKIVKQDKKKEIQKALEKKQVHLPKTIQLHNKPFQELDIEKNSISLIFTDPPYLEKDLHLYQDLAKQAATVLRDGGSLMCYSGHYCIDRVIEFMKNEGLNFHWIIAVLHSGASAAMHGRRILVSYKPILWFVKGKYQGDFVKDVIRSQFQGKELHEWAQSTVESDYYIQHMTHENEIVYDPFMGQGTFGISANRLNRQFIGAEINKDHFENAKKLISIPAKKKSLAEQALKTEHKLSAKEIQERKRQQEEFETDFETPTAIKFTGSFDQSRDEAVWKVFPDCDKCNPNKRVIILSNKTPKIVYNCKFCGTVCKNFLNHLKKYHTKHIKKFPKTETEAFGFFTEKEMPN